MQDVEDEPLSAGRVAGIDIATAGVEVETGVDMTAFPAASRLVSGARWCPQASQSGGKRKRRSTSGRGSP